MKSKKEGGGERREKGGRGGWKRARKSEKIEAWDVFGMWGRGGCGNPRRGKNGRGIIFFCVCFVYKIILAGEYPIIWVFFF